MFNLPPHITVNLKLLLVIIVIFLVAFLIFSALLIDRFHQTKHLHNLPDEGQAVLISLPQHNNNLFIGQSGPGGWL